MKRCAVIALNHSASIYEVFPLDLPEIYFYGRVDFVEGAVLPLIFFAIYH